MLLSYIYIIYYIWNYKDISIKCTFNEKHSCHYKYTTSIYDYTIYLIFWLNLKVFFTLYLSSAIYTVYFTNTKNPQKVSYNFSLFITFNIFNIFTYFQKFCHNNNNFMLTVTKIIYLCNFFFFETYILSLLNYFASVILNIINHEYLNMNT